MVRLFVQAGGTAVDTARIYSGGATEDIVGVACTPYAGAVRIGTKVHPSQPGGLGAAGLRAQFDASVSALGASLGETGPAVEELYLHQPDTEHALQESLVATDKLVREGYVRRVGLSNYHAREVQRAMELCDQLGLVKPSVYQGLYNPLNRMAEEELIPTLRRHGAGFVAYNPLAAGLLTGKHARGAAPPPGRFKDNPNYLPRFYTEPNFEAVGRIAEACAAAGITTTEGSFRWLLHGSALQPDHGDGLLVGASTVQHLKENLGACASAAPLPLELQAVFDGAWAGDVRDGAFFYWRSYSADQPDRQSLHQGASYEAGKT